MRIRSPASPSPLLGPDDPPPFEVVNAAGGASVLVICDHASNRIPHRLGDLGMAAEGLVDHVAWDIGAASVARRLSARLDAPLVLAGCSRLVVDCNRPLENPSAVPDVSDRFAVPGNSGLTADQVRARAEACYWPYHRRVRTFLDDFASRGIVPAVVAVHSFTPVMKGVARPWHIGVLWDRDPRLAVPLMDALRRHPDVVVGDNQPYSAREPQGYSIETHAVSAGLPHLSIEVRQDLIREEAGAARWEALLGEALVPLLANPALYRRQHF